MSNDVQILTTPEVAEDQIRLYICDGCKEIVPIPGEQPPYKYDYLLHTVEAEHGFRGHPFAIIAATAAAWDDTEKGGGRDKILDQIRNALAGGETGFGKEFYDVKDQFREDALSCWAKHNRTENCDDFKTDKMRLQPDTRDLRKHEGLASYQSNIHLCNFCPVASLVEQKLRAKKIAN